MPFVITDPCIGTKDSACVDVCPVDCIHPRKDEPEFETATMLYIHPDECIDCGACVPACPVAAIYDSVESTPASQKTLIEANAVFRAGEADAVARAESLAQARFGHCGPVHRLLHQVPWRSRMYFAMGKAGSFGGRAVRFHGLAR